MICKLKNVDYIHFETIDSTSTWAKANAHTLNPDKLSCITASEQTSGRGRFTRKWLSPRGNIYTTLFFVIPMESSYLPNLGQILAYSCASVLKKKGFEVEIKWPNDLLIEQKKVAGILSETLSMKESCGVVLGIGINVNMGEDLLKAIDQPATSLSQLSMKRWELEEILAPLIEQFLQDFALLQEKGFAPFQPNFQKLLAYKGQEISCRDGAKTVKGICHAIMKDGKLELITSSGDPIILSAGEIEVQHRLP